MKTLDLPLSIVFFCCVGLVGVGGCQTVDSTIYTVNQPHQVSQYVALGDSISTDDYPGPDRGAVSLFYLNDDERFPEFQDKDLMALNAGIQFTLAASNGATTETVLHAQLSSLPPSSPGITLVTLTIGGNDLLRAIHGTPQQMSTYTTKIVKNIDRIITIVQTMYPSSLVLLGTIYDPTDGVGDLFEPGQRLPDALEMLDTINVHIRSFARLPRIYLVDIHKHFLGHGSHHADIDNPYFSKDDSTYWFTSTIEPNERGASEVRRLFWEALQRGLVDLKDVKE